MKITFGRCEKDFLNCRKHSGTDFSFIISSQLRKNNYIFNKVYFKFAIDVKGILCIFKLKIRIDVHGYLAI